VTEGDPGTTPLYTAAATDPGREEISYSLTDDGGGAFRIDSKTGAVTVADAGKPPDAGATIQFTVRAAEADDGGGASTRTAAATTDEAPLSFTSGTTATYPYGSAAPVYQAAASDPDGEPPSYSLSSDPSGVLTIDAAGNVTVQGGKALHAGNYAFTVQATDAD